MNLVALAIAKAGGTDGDKMRLALESLDKDPGLIKTYEHAFSPEIHDALDVNDDIMVHFVGTQIEPVTN
ncbi:MAG TPA: hypothetical protein VET85_13625 [Stellaceae bacterium]|nr:hypothetical protein [Stellaceae bacterium]